MPRSRPPLFDGGGDLNGAIDTGARDRSRANDADDRYDEHHGYDDGYGPNFLIRRAIVVGLVVALIVGVATAVGWFLREDEAAPSASFTSVDWNTVVLVEQNTGTVVMSDETGTETDRIRLGMRSLSDARIAERSLVALAESQVAIVDLTRPDDAPLAVDMVANAPILMPSGSAKTLIVRDANSQRAVFVHGPTGDMIDSNDFAIVGARYDTQLARSDAGGRHILVTDAGNFQSVLFSFDRTEPSFFLGLALAVDNTTVVTAQNVGNAATVSVYDHEGEQVSSATTASVRGAMLAASNVVVVTVNGDVNLMNRDSGDIQKVADLSIGTVEAGHVSPRGDRLIMIGTDGTAIVDSEGIVLAEILDARPTNTGIDAVAPRRNDCLLTARDEIGDVVVVGLTEGNVIAEAVADAEVFAGADGCEPISPTPLGYQVLTNDGVLRTTVAGDVIAASPDGKYVVTDSRNRLALVSRVTGTDADDDAEPIDIGRNGRIVLFADL